MGQSSLGIRHESMAVTLIRRHGRGDPAPPWLCRAQMRVHRTIAGERFASGVATVTTVWALAKEPGELAAPLAYSSQEFETPSDAVVHVSESARFVDLVWPLSRRYERRQGSG